MPSPALQAFSITALTSVDIVVLSCPHPPQPSAFEEKAIEKVDDLLESYMGIRDTELGEWGARVWKAGTGFQVSPRLLESYMGIRDTELGEWGTRVWKAGAGFQVSPGLS